MFYFSSVISDSVVFCTLRTLIYFSANKAFQNDTLLLGPFNGASVPMHFDLPWPLLPSQSNLYGSKWLVQVSCI